ncbi:ABC transporter substrate-binding protein [Geothermobacter hydrogeniphilus]|uniref:ABC transporter substrate-binding protein n=1 Tax=Geothermobacter hydrogeniphilus TaxID=1969733 RepID=UPI00155557EB|nr:ABC transporter substrate-binding protein [Geothermobacter hydrogeniphilus]
MVLQLKWRHQFQFAGYYAAMAKGFYRAEGLRVEVREGSPGQDIVQELVSGRAQYMVHNSTALLACAGGAPLVALAVVFQQSPLALIAREDSGINSLADLAGKPVMLSPTTEPELVAMLRAEGFNLNQFQFQLLPHSGNPEDLVSGRVAAMAGYLTDLPFYLEQRNVRPVVIRPSHYGINFYGDTLFTSRHELEDHPQQVAAFRRASLKGWDYAMQHPGEIVELILRRYPGRLNRGQLLNEAEQMRRLILPDLVEIGHMNPSRWQHIAQVFSDAGMLPGRLDLGMFLYHPDRPGGGFPGWLAPVSGVFFAILLLLLLFNWRLRHAVTHRTVALDRVNRNLQQMLALKEKAEQDLVVKEQQLRTIVESVLQGLLIVAEDRILFANRAAAEIVGCDTAEELLAMGWIDNFIAPHEHTRLHAYLQDRLSGKNLPESYVFEGVRRDGSRGWVENRAVRIEWQGRPAVLVSMTDVTERVRLREESIRAAQLASLGELAASVAHEINNPINGIINYAQILKNALVHEEKWCDIAGRILKESDRVATIVAGLLSFSRSGAAERKTIRIHDILEDTLVLVRTQLQKDGICLDLDIPETLPLVRVVPQQIQQVYLNLINNARYALNQKYLHPCAEKRLQISCQLQDDSCLATIFYDQGIGIADQDLERVLAPFFTTKPGKEGAGLGLSISCRIMQDHGGDIRIESRNGEFTRVVTILPVN